MTYNTYIFDLDGTLLDTLQDLAASVNYALHQHHMPEHSVDDVRHFVGNGVRLLMERAVPGGAGNPQFDAAFDTFRQHYMQHSLETTRPYDGIPELIHHGQNGYVTPVNTPEALAEGIAYLFADENRYREWSLNARRQIEENNAYQNVKAIHSELAGVKV